MFHFQPSYFNEFVDYFSHLLLRKGFTLILFGFQDLNANVIPALCWKVTGQFSGKQEVFLKSAKNS